MTSVTQVQPREFKGEEDIQLIYDLLAACEAEDKLDELESANYLRLFLTAPEVDQKRDIRLWESSDGQVVGFAHLEIPESGQEDGKLHVRLHFSVHPQFRQQDLESRIMEWAKNRLNIAAAERGMHTVSLTAGARDIDEKTRGILERYGFTPVRYFFRMVRPLGDPIPQPVLPEGYVSTYARADAEQTQEWCDCFNESFIDHWNFHPFTLESALHWNDTNANFRPENNLIAVAPDGHFAAFCYCEIDPDDQKITGRKEGWIHLVGTRRGHRKIGLGRAMLLTGMHRLKELGADTAMLGVDAENPTGALGLYESSGFHKARTNIVHGKEWDVPTQS